MKFKFIVPGAFALSCFIPMALPGDFGVLSTSTPPVAAQDKEKDKSALEKKVRKLLVVTGAGKLGKQMMEGMVKSFRRMPNLDPRFLDRFMKAAKPEDLVELIVPIYVKHLDEKTVDATLAFFQTPAGKKYIEKQPTIATESMRAGQKWGRELAQKVMADLMKEK